MPWAFLHCLHQMYLRSPDWENGESLVWAPRDRNGKVYPVEIINFLVDGEEFNVRWTGEDEQIGRQLMFSDPKPGSTQGRNPNTSAPVELWFRIQPEVAPNASMFLIEGSATAELGQIELE